VRLAGYAAGLRFEDIPAEIVGRAKECIADTVAAIVCGAALPWSRIAMPSRSAAYRLERNQPQRVGCVGFQ
jgi:hypothetical protein